MSSARRRCYKHRLDVTFQLRIMSQCSDCHVYYTLLCATLPQWPRCILHVVAPYIPVHVRLCSTQTMHTTLTLDAHQDAGKVVVDDMSIYNRGETLHAFVLLDVGAHHMSLRIHCPREYRPRTPSYNQFIHVGNSVCRAHGTTWSCEMSLQISNDRRSSRQRFVTVQHGHVTTWFSPWRKKLSTPWMVKDEIYAWKDEEITVYSIRGVLHRRFTVHGRIVHISPEHIWARRLVSGRGHALFHLDKYTNGAWSVES